MHNIKKHAEEKHKHEVVFESITKDNTDTKTEATAENEAVATDTTEESKNLPQNGLQLMVSG